MERRRKICFVSKDNTCRSIIAELHLRNLGRQFFEVQSFGLTADRVHHSVQNVMLGRDINPNYSFSKVFEVIENQRFDIIVLMHQDLKEKLPEIPYDYELLTWDFDPVDFRGSDEDQITEEIETLSDRVEKQVKSFIEKYK
jgi:protein-tyrosine-phosphatase